MSVAQWKDSKPAELGSALASVHVAEDDQNQDTQVVSTSLAPPLRKVEGGLASSRRTCLAKHGLPINPWQWESGSNGRLAADRLAADRYLLL